MNEDSLRISEEAHIVAAIRTVSFCMQTWKHCSYNVTAGHVQIECGSIWQAMVEAGIKVSSQACSA